MKTLRPRTFEALRYLSIGAILVAAAGCDRKQRDGVPVGIAPPEAPLVPRVNPARPESDGTHGSGPALDHDEHVAEPAHGTTAAAASGTDREAEARFKVAPGYQFSGSAELDEVATGVKVVVDLRDAPAGKKGIHVHEKGDCSDIPGKSMGEHFAPNAEKHGLPPHAGRHLGDLGNLQIGKDGKSHFEFTATNANLKKGDPMSFLGRAIVIHEGEDKGSQPSGGAGKPMACAVIEPD